MGTVHNQPDIDDVVFSLRQVAKDYGIEKMALAMGTAVGTLYNKLNLNDSSMHHKPTVADLVQITFIAKDTTPIETLARMFRGVFVKLPDMSKLPDEELLELVNRWGAEAGDVHDVMARALADGVVTADEFDEFRDQSYDAIAALLELKARFKTLVIKGKK